MTQAQLARKAKVSRPYITMLEQGKRETPSASVLARIAGALGVSGRELMTPRTEMVNVKDIVGVLCGWAGCRAMAKYGAGGRVPEGWRALVVSKYSLLEPSGVLNSDVDMMLCPEHIDALQRLLKTTK